ncbi:uncharacterized protein MELLADRAFT_86918 [Melampsora larici-populina 98AG31]|uniref:Secreted protein n=1 Tax=Melampsora larici-populina (strain 98AG31 / pathotype 3-4-7) TaxID=747676 RepID=F4R3V2_MELLP|nr:uncharacterized protein MELLADRAFT_86918 [Melampsora larici-populina 98AG31]EGG13099.1 secreted protein [Melampsora larici-populina 98AG31]
MLSFIAPHLILILICIIRSALAGTNGTTVQCVDGFGGINATASTAKCNDRNYTPWICPLAECGKDGHLWVPMSGCVLDVVDGAGASNQQCASYNIQNETMYECRNSGGISYLCPYTAANVPYITCSGCNLQPESQAKNTP